jgi:hypothetical protein
MKKNVKLMCVALILSTTIMAQQIQKVKDSIKASPPSSAKGKAGGGIPAYCPYCLKTVDHTEMAAHQETCASKPKTEAPKKTAKITFPPNAFSSPQSKTITILGTTEEGVVIETDKGVKLLVAAENNATPVEANKRWTPIVPRPRDPIVYKMIGTTDDGTQVWAGPDGKGCTLDVAKGKMVDYIGHVTLLR